MNLDTNGTPKNYLSRNSHITNNDPVNNRPVSQGDGTTCSM